MEKIKKAKEDARKVEIGIVSDPKIGKKLGLDKTDPNQRPKFYWRNDNDGFPSLLITIPTNREKLADVIAAEEALAKIGIRFDTGYGFGGRDWEFDWSLSGRHFRPEALKNGKIRYKETSRSGGNE